MKLLKMSQIKDAIDLHQEAKHIWKDEEGLNLIKSNNDYLNAQLEKEIEVSKKNYEYFS